MPERLVTAIINLGNVYGTSGGYPKLIVTVGDNVRRIEAAGIENVVAHKLKNIAVESVGTAGEVEVKRTGPAPKLGGLDVGHRGEFINALEHRPKYLEGPTEVVKVKRLAVYR